MTVTIGHQPLSQAYPSFSLSVCIQYNTLQAEERKKRGRPGNTCHVNDVWWTQGGGRGGGVPNYKFVCNKSQSKFLTGEIKYCRSREHLGSRLSERSMMKSSMLFECGPLPPLTSTYYKYSDFTQMRPQRSSLFPRPLHSFPSLGAQKSWRAWYTICASPLPFPIL